MSPGPVDALAAQSLEAPLSGLPRRTPLGLRAEAPLAEGLALMQAHGVGSVLVLDQAGAAVGILTRHDLLPRVALREPPLDIRATAMRDVMTQPVHTLDIGASVHEAAMLMLRQGVRHVPLTQGGRVVSLVSERDLFALQRQSLRALGQSLRAATDLGGLLALAPGIREFARQLAAQGIAARPLTDMVSHLNDLLTRRLVEILAAAHGLDLGRACWLAFGSEGRGEQTLSTDQDNGLVLVDEVEEPERGRWLEFGREANQALDDCGFPLCRGGIMAGNPACCLRLHDWRTRFEQWIRHGEPLDLLQANIYFDLRPIAGEPGLAVSMRECITALAAQAPRFIRQLADNSLHFRPALNWRGALDTVTEGEHRWVDLKLRGTAVFVDAARLYALAHGVDAVGTGDRLRAVGARLDLSDDEVGGWIAGFEALQMLRLRRQMGLGEVESGDVNRIDLRSLNAFDRRMLLEAMKVAQGLQQRIALDWPGR